MEANEIIRTVENAGGELWVAGETLRYRLPESASSLVDEIRVSKWGRDWLGTTGRREIGVSQN